MYFTRNYIAVASHSQLPIYLTLNPSPEGEGLSSILKDGGFPHGCVVKGTGGSAARGSLRKSDSHSFRSFFFNDSGFRLHSISCESHHRLDGEALSLRRGLG